MALDKPYKQVPGTTIFDAEQSAQGVSPQPVLHVADEAREPRAATSPTSEAYLDEWPLTRRAEAGAARPRPERGDRARAATSTSSQDRRHPRPVLPADGRLDDRHVRGRLPRHDGRRRSVDRGQPLNDLDGWAPPSTEKSEVTRPGAAGQVHRRRVHLTRAGDRRGDGPPQDRGAVLEGGLRRLRVTPKQWAKENTPTSSSSSTTTTRRRSTLSIIPTFVLGTGAAYPAADEGYGPRPVPGIEGDPDVRRAHRPLADP